jgi:DnaJ family protein C protein 17
MADQDLITYARDAAARGDDLFALLATDATASESDIRRAFRRKALTAHPDKAGDAYDPALYERLERARDVLVSPEAREAYDTGMRAILQKKLQREQMTDKRRRLVEDLERREAEAKRVKTAGPQAGPQDAERRAMAERGRAKMEEMRRLREQAEVRERLAKEKEEAAAAAAAAATGETNTDKVAQGGHPTPPAAAADDYDERIAELEMRLKESQQRKAEKQQRKEERKAEKKGKTGKKSGSPPAPGSPGEKIPDNPPPSTAAEPQADEDKLSKPAEAAPLAPQPIAGDPPKASDRFASTLARLRAAQAKKDEEKKRKAAE